MSDYEVGYGKPPRHTRFQKGRSGNPRGRPKAALNLKTVVLRELGEPIVIREGGRERKVSKLEAAVKSLINKALKGDVRAVVELFDMRQRWAEDEVSGQAAAPLTADEQAVVDDVIARLLGNPDIGFDDVATGTKPVADDEEPVS